MKHLVKNNPRNLIRGTKLLLINTPAGSGKVEGEIYETKTNSASVSSGSIPVIDKNGITKHFYYSSPADIFILASRKDEAIYLREKLKSMKVEAEDMEIRIEHLEMFETEEEYVAYKLSKILEAGANPKAIAEILKTMKESNLL